MGPTSNEVVENLIKLLEINYQKMRNFLFYYYYYYYCRNFGKKIIINQNKREKK